MARTQATKTPLGIIRRMMPNMKVLLVKVDADCYSDFAEGDEIMLINRTRPGVLTELPVVPRVDVPLGWITLVEFARHEDIPYATARARAVAGTLAALRVPTPSGKGLRWIVRTP